MVAPLIAVATATAVMTLRSDTKPVTVYVKSPKGTLYWGGAGLDGKYIQPTLAALTSAGIKNVSVGLTNSATQSGFGNFGMVIDAIRAGIAIRYEDNAEWTISSGMSQGEQFNLIGYSYGSLLAAQTANFYAKQGVLINNLVLIGSPIDNDFLLKLKSNPKIGKVVVINLTNVGDHIYAGIPQIELSNPLKLKKLATDMLEDKGNGHFYFAHMVPDLPRRLELLAQLIHQQGVR